MRPHAGIRRLASTVLFSLDQTYSLGLQPGVPGIREGKFYGAHLRTAKDATWAGWTPYEVQSKYYVTSCSHYGLKVMYLTSGNPDDAEKFYTQVGNRSIAVTTKTALLSKKGFEKEAEEIKALTWDQQGMCASPSFPVPLHACLKTIMLMWILG